MKKYTRAFTLIELMIVVSIIAFLAILVTAYLRTQVFKSYDARRKADIKRIGIAVEEYEKDNNCYPPAALVTCSNGGTGLQPYYNSIPCDPTTKDSYAYQTDGTACSKWYILYTALVNDRDPDFTPGIGPSSLYSFYYASPNAPKVVSKATGDIFYGCFNGTCTQIFGTVCQPTYGAKDCYGKCGTSQSPENECDPIP